MNTFLLILIIFGSSIQSVAQKAYNLKTGSRGAFTFSAASTLAAALFFIISALSSGRTFFMPSEVLLYAVGFAVSYGVAVTCALMAIGCGSLSFTSLITSYSMVIPTVYGLLFLKEEGSKWLYVGIMLLILSLFMINQTGDKADEKARITPRWGLYVLLAFAGNGACSTVQKVQQLQFNGAYKNEFMITALLLVAVFLFGCAFFSERKEVPKYMKSGVGCYLLCGGANGLVNLLVMILGRTMPASVMFPLISAGGIVATVTVSIFLYKERISKPQIAGILLGIGAIVFLNL